MVAAVNLHLHNSWGFPGDGSARERAF